MRVSAAIKIGVLVASLGAACASAAVISQAELVDQIMAGARDAGLDLQGRSVVRPGPVIPGLGATATVLIPLDESGRPSGVKARQGVFAARLRVGFVSGKGEVFAQVDVVDVGTGQIVAAAGEGLSNEQFRALMQKHGLGSGKTETEVLNSPEFRREFAAAEPDSFQEAVAQALRAVGVAGARFDTSRFVDTTDAAAPPAGSPAAPPPAAEDVAPPPPVRVRGGLDNLGSQSQRLSDADVTAIVREFAALQAQKPPAAPPAPAPAPTDVPAEPRRQKAPTSQETDLFADVFFRGALTFGVEAVRGRQAADESNESASDSRIMLDELREREERERELERARRGPDPGIDPREARVQELIAKLPPDKLPSGLSFMPLDEQIEVLERDLEYYGLADAQTPQPTRGNDPLTGELPSPEAAAFQYLANGVTPNTLTGAFDPAVSGLLLPAIASNIPGAVVVDVVAPAPPPPAPAGVSFSGNFPFLTSSFDLGGGVTSFDVFLTTPQNITLVENGVNRDFRLDDLFAFARVGGVLVVGNGLNNPTPFNLDVTVTGDALVAAGGGQFTISNATSSNFTQGGTPVTVNGDPNTTGQLGVRVSPR